jgi:DnaJ domain
MPYRRGPRDHPSRADFLVVWLSLVFCLLFPFAAFILFDSLEAAAIVAVIIIPTTALIFEMRRRRAVWQRWQSQQKHWSRFEGRDRANEGRAANERPWWQVLGISEQSAPDDVKAAYHAMIKQYHPDTVMGLAREFQELAERKTKEINRAYGQACRTHRMRSSRESQDNETRG